jgi:two-component system, probable response regulator PhcQ
MTHTRFVLVADDDPMVRRCLIRDLSRHFVVVEADSFASAMAILRGPEQFLAVVTDRDMGPGPDGIELLVQARLLHPEAARVLVSGSVSPKAADDILDQGIAHQVIPKPWTAGALQGAVTVGASRPGSDADAAGAQ